MHHAPRNPETQTPSPTTPTLAHNVEQMLWEIGRGAQDPKRQSALHLELITVSLLDKAAYSNIDGVIFVSAWGLQ